MTAMPSAPLSRADAYDAALELILRVPDADLREALIHATIDYGHAAATEAMNRAWEAARAR